MYYEDVDNGELYEDVDNQPDGIGTRSNKYVLDPTDDSIYDDTADEPEAVEPTILQEKPVSTPTEVHVPIPVSEKTQQIEHIPKKGATYTLTQSKMLLLILTSCIVAMVVSMGIMYVIIRMDVIPKTHSNGKITTMDQKSRAKDAKKFNMKHNLRLCSPLFLASLPPPPPKKKTSITEFRFMIMVLIFL